MNNNIIAQSSAKVFEFAFLVRNEKNNDDIQILTATFKSFPTSQDWKKWFSGWASIGYKIATPPELINVC